MNLAPAALPSDRPQASLTTQTLISQLRSDLADTNSATYRWSDADLTRMIDRVLEEYSRVNPNRAAIQIPTITKSRLYPSPEGAWWLERCEFPVGSWPKQYQTFQERTSPKILAPSAAPILTAGPGILTGIYHYAVTFLVPGCSAPGSGAGETDTSPLANTDLNNGSVTLTQIPTGPYGVVDRAIYRTKAGAAQLQLLTTLGDNTTDTYFDNLADGLLGAYAPITTNTTDGIPQFELNIGNAYLPNDTSGSLELTAAYKHELDPLGTTVPEKHWDCLALGATAYALFQYLTTTNDNLDYVDGQFRDRVDDSKAPLAWRLQAQDTYARYQARLLEIKDESQHRSTPNPHWGDRPIWWDRL